MIDPLVKAKAEKFNKWAKVGGIVVAGFVVAPFAFTAIGGIVGAATAGVLGMAVVSLTPWVSLKITNWKYRLIDAEKNSHIKKVNAEATENPIETLTIILQENTLAYDKFKLAVTNEIAVKNGVEKKLEEFAVKFPHRAKEFKDQLARLNTKIEAKKAKLSKAKAELASGRSKLEEMEAYWDMSQSMQESNKASGMTSEDPFMQMKMDTAVDAVFNSMSKAFAQLEVEDHLDNEPNNSQLGLGMPEEPVIIVTDIKVKEAVR